MGVLDAHYYFDKESKTPYLFWKTDDNAVGKPSAIYMRELNQDGRSFKSKTQPKKILQSDRKEVTIKENIQISI